jgi:hypothetical protein
MVRRGGVARLCVPKIQSEHSHAIHLHYQAALGSLSWIAFRRCSALRSV